MLSGTRVARTLLAWNSRLGHRHFRRHCGHCSGRPLYAS